MKIMQFILILILAVFTAGCVELETELVFSPDGQSILKKTLKLSKEILPGIDKGKVLEQVNRDSVEITETDDFIIISDTERFMADQFSAYGIEYSKSISGYNLIYSPDFNEFDRDSIKADKFIHIIDLSVTVTDGSILSGNADSISDNTAYWSLDPADESINDFKAELYVSTTPRFTYYIIFFAALLVIVAVILILRRNRSNASE